MIIVHTLAHAHAAMAAAHELGIPVSLQSAPGAAAYAGAAYFQAMIAEARERYPTLEVMAVLDCGRRPGLALAALRQGIKAVRLQGRRSTIAKVADIAATLDAELNPRAGRALDLLDVPDPAVACLEWLRPNRR